MAVMIITEDTIIVHNEPLITATYHIQGQGNSSLALFIQKPIHEIKF